MKKRLVAFLLVLIMVLGMLPVSAFAADDGVSPQALESNETQTIKYQILYVGDEFNIGYNYGASVNKTYTCQYSTGHSGFNHSILISEFRNVGVPALKGQLDSGYEFVGWAKEAKKNPTIFDFNTAGTTATQTTYTIYLVAKKTNPTPTYMYYLYYKYNDGTDSTWLTDVTDRPTAATTFTFNVNRAKLTRSGYDHIGWADKADAVTAKYTGGDPIVLTKDNPTKTIYAIWMPFFELKYDANGGTGAPASQTRTAAHPTVNRVTFTVPNQTPSKEGYTFKGWADSSTATTAQYQPGDTVDVKHENSPKTVYAVWEGSDPIPVPSYDDLKSAIGKIQVKDVSTPSCGTENYDLIDNTQSEPFNWTKTARLDQPGKYDVTIKTAPYVAKYNSEKSKTHELNNANQTTLKLVISYENNTWKLDDGLRVIEVKHSEQTPPTDKPDKPTKNDVTGVVVDIVCVTTTGTHDTVQYPLGHPTDAQHTIGEVVSDGAGGYICPVTVRTAWFVQQASNLVWKVQHTPTAQTITFNLTYDKTNKKWVKPAANPRIEATHEVTPPTKPTALDGSFAIVCKNNEATHAYKADYIATPSQYTISDVQKDEQGYYVTATVTVAPNLVAYNKATRVEHRLVDEQDATLTITFRYDTEATVDGNRKWKQQGDLPVVEVICKEIEAPTREDIFGALNGLVTVTCINRFWKDGNNNMDCGQGQYAAKAGIAGQEYTLEKGENAGTWVVTFPVTNFVKSFKQNPAHHLYTKDTLSWYIRWKDNAWTSAPVEPGVDDLVKLTHAPTTFDEVTKFIDGRTDVIKTSCVNGETATCAYGLMVAFVNPDHVVSVEQEKDSSGQPIRGSYIATLKMDQFAETCAKACNNKSFADAPRTHKLLTQETVQWRLYATPEEDANDKIGNNVPNHVWEAEPVEAGKDDVCTIAHNWVVTFDPNNGGDTFTQNVEYEGKAIKPTPDPEKTGYTFDGWYLGDEKYDFSDAVEQNITLYANWEKNIYTVTYTDGVDGEEVFADQTYRVPFEDTTPAFKGTKTRDGYVFDGWKPAFSDTVTGNVTYVAQWTARTDLSYTVHYYLKNTTKKVADDKTVDGQTFNAVVKEEAIRISGYRVYGDSEKSITIGTGTNEIIFYYTRASRPSASSTSKPTLNTGDHYAYVMGYPDGTVRPNGSITRAEVSAILFRLLSDKTRDEYFTTESSFTDVKAGAWYNNSIATLEKAGVIVDTAKGGAFRPNEAITRAELAAMLAQFSDAKPVKGVKFSDVSAEHWAYEAIAIAAKMGWIEGYPDGTFRPDATITRAEMMTLVNRALERVPSDEDHLLSKRVMLTFPDCKSGDWFYIAVQEATNSHTYERAATEKNGDEQWTALRANRDWTQLEK